MTAKSVSDRIEELESKIAKMNAKKRRLKAKASKEQRAKDTRRKILLGALLLKVMEDPKQRAAIRARLGRFLEKDRDKALFAEEWWAEQFPPRREPLPSTSTAKE